MDVFIKACKDGDVTVIRHLVSANNLSQHDVTEALREYSRDNGRTPRLSTDVMQCLLELGADPSSLDIRGISTLDQLKLLSRYGFDIKRHGHLVLEDVVDSREALEWLLDQGVDINQPDSKRTTGGVLVTGSGYDHSLGVLNNVAARGDIDTFDWLVSRGADPSLSRSLHHVPRIIDEDASVGGKTEAMINHLLDNHGFEVDKVKDEPLRKLGFDYQRIRDNGSPLNCSVVHKNMSALTALLKRGADANGGPASDHAPAHTAITLRSPWLPALAPLFEAGADPTSALVQAVLSDNVDAARICLEHGADVDAVKEEEKLTREEQGVDEDDEDFEFMSDEMRAVIEA
ncbi:uncharacterized protein PG998_003956 [Apiospora kogelbergensis]|uniref:uncharacterized protein n=1 Tax=Apiospora kogelbergensis TaxID=1337665 RepID=UPI00313173F5